MILKLEKQEFCIKVFFNLKVTNDLAYAIKALSAKNLLDLFQELIDCIWALVAWVVEGNCLNELFLGKLLILVELWNELFFLLNIQDILAIKMLEKKYIVNATWVQGLVLSLIDLVLFFLSLRQKHALKINPFVVS